MAKVLRIKVNYSGVGKLLKSAEMQAICAEHAQEIATRCGEGYETESRVMGTRAIATVYPATAAARRDAHKNNTIEKALG